MNQEKSSQYLDASDLSRAKIRQLYSFLKEANQLQFKPVRKLVDHPHVIRLADIPRHPSAQIFRPVKIQESQEIPDILVRVSRPKLTKCPNPPASIEEWLLPKWDDPLIKPEFAESTNKTEIDQEGNETTITIQFEDDEGRFNDFFEWDELREKWRTPEIVARGAMKFFEDFYSLYAKLEKEGERLELLIADGILSWAANSGNDGAVAINHPLLLKRVELRFNPNIPEFTIHETDREVELYTSLFLDLKNVESAAIRDRKIELETAAYHPLGWDDTSAYLRSVAITLSPTDGEFLEEPSDGQKPHPRIWRQPVLLLRKRVAGLANAVDRIIDDIDAQAVFPSSLTQITGGDKTWINVGLSSGSSEGLTGTTNFGIENQIETSSQDVLLVNDANDEQIQIVKRLDRSGAVVVQGPPGTGKTHTISNLIGHLLSQGKSILVTAHTAKALRVLHDKVPDMLKPLCVSVLGSDQAARRQLESAVSSITERLTSETSESLLRKSKLYSQERKQLITREIELRHKLREAIENEYKEIETGDKKVSPSDAARFIDKNREQHSWIPSPIKIEAEIGNYLSDISRLYLLGATFSSAEEADSRLNVPKIETLPTEALFESMVADYQSLVSQDLTTGKDKWTSNNLSSESLSKILELLDSEFNDELLSQTWRPYAIVTGIHSGDERKVWEALISKVEQAVTASSRYNLVLHHKPVLDGNIPIQKQLEVVCQICSHLEQGGKLGFLQLATKPEWRQLINGVLVTAGKPNHIEHFLALKHLSDLESQRLAIQGLWDTLIGVHLNKKFSQLGLQPEQSCRALIPEIKRCLDWHTNVWTPIAKQLRNEGLKLDELLATLPRETTQIAEYEIIEKFATFALIGLVQVEAGRRKLTEIEFTFNKLRNLVTQVDPSRIDQGCVGAIVEAVKTKSSSTYGQSLIYLRRIIAVKPLVEERDKLLEKLRLIAPNWASLLKDRIVPHNQKECPGNINQAWLFRQLDDTLIDRDKLDAQEIQAEIENTNLMTKEVTRHLVDSLAWGGQLERLHSDNSMRQALVGWLDTAKRLASTRQLGKRQTLLTEARKLMRRCSEAVPVWIMPISIMAESFDPQSTKFDVVIIDEASQADINALIPLYMGKKIIVVGDHEQVTPLGVGKDQTILENLRKSMLKDIPNAHLYDNMSSIYDIARQSFGEGIRLVEHFRCVPEIIGFSNALSYEGKIRPLRESSSSNLLPACVPLKVSGIREGDTNKIEAEQIVSFIKAMIKHPAYKGKTIGVISMLGESQAVLVQSMIHKEIESIEIESRRIQAGISGEFQGDERDVIFLSLVDSAIDTSPLRTTGDGAFEQTKKRYNVATSRARDQLWVLHSFDPDLHLKAVDIRYRLIQHVRDPKAAARNFDEQVGRVESPFEREVLRKLTNAGYRVTTQVEVGYFRIDMVVEGQGKRLAVECDGDRYHPIEKLSEDMNRQSILERLGWKFSRIRGSSFYRNPDAAMQSVYAKLNELEIFPTSSSSPELPPSNLVIELKEIISRGFLDEFSDRIVATSEAIDSISEIDDSTETVSQDSNHEVDVERESELEPNFHSKTKSEIPPSNQLGIEGFEIPQFTQQNRSVNTNLSVIAKPVSGLILYTSYSGDPCPDPRTSLRDRIADGLYRIIREEGPVQVKRLFDIYLRSCGIKRMGHELRDSLLSALNSLLQLNALNNHCYLPGDDKLNAIVWLALSPPEIVRTRGDRSLEEIPIGELRSVYELVVARIGVNKDEEDYMREMLELLDLKRLTSLTESILKRVIAGDFHPVVLK
jgi:very-short-patch-repair endonuclease/superfamily I DNA/RNA helicase